jgi:hypothetical protein
MNVFVQAFDEAYYEQTYCAGGQDEDASSAEQAFFSAQTDTCAGSCRHDEQRNVDDTLPQGLGTPYAQLLPSQPVGCSNSTAVASWL